MPALRDAEDFHDFVAEVVDDFDGDAAGGGCFEGARGVAVQGAPGFFVDFGSQCGAERFIRIVGAEEVGVADEEAFFVVIGIDEPAGDAVGVVAADFAAVGVEDVDAVEFDLPEVVFEGDEVNIGFAEDDEEVGFVGFLEVGGHVEVGVHAGFEDGDAAEFGEVGAVGVEVEGAGDKDVEFGVGGFAGGFD